MDINQVRQISRGHEPATLVDARDPMSFYLDHIPNARNVPLAANDEDFRATLTGLPRDGRLVLYCVRDTCHIVDQLAARLAAEGFTRLEIFRGGWELWEKSKNEQLPAS